MALVINIDTFLAEYRRQLPLPPPRDEHLFKFLMFLQSDKLLEVQQRPLECAAYMMATAYHEAGAMWHPIEEYWDRSFPSAEAYFIKRYGHRRDLGNRTPMDGYTFRGRGLAMITGFENYDRMSREIGVDLVEDPDKALDVYVSYQILSIGMLKGLFTGLPLSRFVNAAGHDYLNSRKVVNGMDRASYIANLASRFETMLLKAA